MCAFKTSLVSYSSALQKCFLKYTFIVLVAICSDFGNQSNKICHGFHCFAIYLPWIDGTRFHDLHFLNVEFLANFFTLTFIKRLFSSSLLSAIRVVSSLYLRLLILFPATLILACASFSPAFHMMYSAYMLNKQDDNIQPWCTPFPIWNQSVVHKASENLFPSCSCYSSFI